MVQNSTRLAPHQDGFTLVELLISILIISVLLAIAVPSLGLARSRARSAHCLASLHDIHIMHTLYADQFNKGRYANAFEPGTTTASWTLGETLTISDRTLLQTFQWLAPFAAAGWTPQWLEDGNSYCRAAVRNLPEHFSETNPQVLAHWSYWYSASLFTAAELWDPAHPERRANPDQWRRSVGLHQVLYPDRKVLLFENGDHHGSGLYLGEFGIGRGRTNVVCCDGHATTVDPYAGNSALTVPWPNQPGAIHFEGAMPFSSADFGFMGADW